MRMLQTRNLLGSFSTVLLLLSSAYAADPAVPAEATPSGDLQFPALTRPVMDEAGYLPAGDVQQIETVLREMQRQGKGQMAVYVPSSMKGYDVEGFSLKVAEAWKLGKKGTDRGLLLVIAPQERQMRLEVGYGLEGVLPDAMARRLLDQTLKPALREGRPGEGVLVLVGQVARILETDLQSLSPEERAKLEASAAPRAAPKRFGNLLMFLPIIFLFGGGLAGALGALVIGVAIFFMTGSIALAAIAFMVVNLLSFARRGGGGGFGRRRRGGIFMGGLGGGGLGGLGGGGGFGGFGGGGGSFGGGGASSRW